MPIIVINKNGFHAEHPGFESRHPASAVMKNTVKAYRANRQTYIKIGNNVALLKFPQLLLLEDLISVAAVLYN